MLTPVQTPPAATTSTSITEQNRPTKLHLIPHDSGTLTPESSPLGVLSPAATNAAVSLVMNSVKRPFVLSGMPGIVEEEPEVKRFRSGAENGLGKDDLNGQSKDH